MELKVECPAFDEAIKDLNAQAQPYRQTSKLFSDRITKTEEERDKYIFENKLYLPLEILQGFIGRDVSSITFYDENGDVFDYYNDDGCDCIEQDGHYHHSSYVTGLVTWSDKDGFYSEWYHYRKTPRKFVGIKEVNFLEESW